MTKMKAALVVTAVATTVAMGGCPEPCAAPGAQEQWLLGTIDDGTAIEVRAFEVLSEGINAGTEFGGDDTGALETTGDFGADRFELVIEQGDHTIEIALFDVDAVGVWTVGVDAEARITVDGAAATSGTLTTGADGENGGRTFVIDAAIDDAPLTGALELFAFSNDSGCV